MTTTATDIRRLAEAASAHVFDGATSVRVLSPEMAEYVDAILPDAILALLDERDRLREALEDMTCQFACWTPGPNPGLTTGGLSTLEDAFDALGWAEPHDVPERRCDEPGCAEEATCGWPARPGGTGPNGGYRRTCHRHMAAGDDR